MKGVGNPAETYGPTLGAAVKSATIKPACLSTRGKQRVVPGAGHVIHADKPEAVVDAVLEVLNRVKQKLRLSWSAALAVLLNGRTLDRSV